MKSILPLLLFLSVFIPALSVSAQDYLFVGLYRVPQVKGPCNNVEMIQIAASTKKEAYNIQVSFTKQYRKKESYKVLGPTSRAVVIAFEKAEPGSNCTSNIKTLMKDKTQAEAQAWIEKEYEKNRKKYVTKPSIIFVWEGKKK